MQCLIYTNTVTTVVEPFGHKTQNLSDVALLFKDAYLNRVLLYFSIFYFMFPLFCRALYKVADVNYSVNKGLLLLLTVESQLVCCKKVREVGCSTETKASRSLGSCGSKLLNQLGNVKAFM